MINYKVQNGCYNCKYHAYGYYLGREYPDYFCKYKYKDITQKQEDTLFREIYSKENAVRGCGICDNYEFKPIN